MGHFRLLEYQGIGNLEKTCVRSGNDSNIFLCYMFKDVILGVGGTPFNCHGIVHQWIIECYASKKQLTVSSVNEPLRLVTAWLGKYLTMYVCLVGH